MARKIDDEADALAKPKQKKGGKGGKKNIESETETAEESVPTEEVPATSTSSSASASDEPEFKNEGYSDSGASNTLVQEGLERKEEPQKPNKGSFREKTNPFESDLSSMKVPRQDPLKQTIVPPEVVFFGEPRQPPPGEAARDSKYHGSLLYWARHATVAPRTSDERLTLVYPRGRLFPTAPKYRLEVEGLSFQKILTAFEAVMDDLDASKAFVDSNIDLIPSKLFLRVLTAEKLTKQSKDDLEGMDHLKEVRRRYILAHDQVFFPLNLEIQKAETRVMTYLAREELRNFAAKWDEVEMSLHFTTLLAARLTWDSKVRGILDEIKIRIKNTVGYMAQGLEKDLMAREFRKPAITSEVYLNASMSIQFNMPELYARVKPEVQLLHETFFLIQNPDSTEELRRYVNEEFCPRAGITPPQLKERLKIFEATLAAVQGVDYVYLRVRAQETYRKLCDKEELKAMDKWFFDYKEKGYGFQTYEPNEVPKLIQYQQRIRDTGNAFNNFAVDVMKMPTKYSESLSGKRPKGDQVDNWLEKDPEWSPKIAQSYDERMDEFRSAYITQTELRKEAESRLTKMIGNRMAVQEKVLYANKFTDRDEYPGFDEGDSKVVKFDGED